MEIALTFPEQPTTSKLIITLNTEQEDGEFVYSDNVMSETQYVVAVGPYVKGINPGTKVRIDIEKMMEYIPNPNNTHETISTVKLSPIHYDGVTYAIINDSLVKTVFINNQPLQTNE